MIRAVVTGSAGLVGSAVTRHLCSIGLQVYGVDNDMRGQFFGPGASTHHSAELLKRDIGEGYVHLSGDIRNADVWEAVEAPVGLVVHCASQPSHDWAAGVPLVDFDINARATLQLLEWIRHTSPGAAVVYMSTNKVYGDWVNHLSTIVELESRYDMAGPLKYGINESFPIEGSLHSLFGISKLAGDLLVQEYGRYFGLSTYCLRCGCLTGAGHKGAEQHGFLAYLAKCIREGTKYTIYGYKGKQVRDNLHATDVARAVQEIYQNAESGAHVYNLGGGRDNAVSLLEAMRRLETLTDKRAHYEIDPNPRVGDHVWWITSTKKFREDFPGWGVRVSIDAILEELACCG